MAFLIMVSTRKGGCYNIDHCTANVDGAQTRLCSQCTVVRFCGKKARLSAHIYWLR
jgi:hypothetical protein